MRAYQQRIDPTPTTAGVLDLYVTNGNALNQLFFGDGVGGFSEDVRTTSSPPDGMTGFEYMSGLDGQPDGDPYGYPSGYSHYTLAANGYANGPAGCLDACTANAAGWPCVAFMTYPTSANFNYCYLFQEGAANGWNDQGHTSADQQGWTTYRRCTGDGCNTVPVPPYDISGMSNETLCRTTPYVWMNASGDFCSEDGVATDVPTQLECEDIPEGYYRSPIDSGLSEHMTLYMDPNDPRSWNGTMSPVLLLP